MLDANDFFNETDCSLSEGDASASNRGALEMNGWMFVNEGNLCFCWVQLVEWANANEQANTGASHMAVFANASVSSILVYMP